MGAAVGAAVSAAVGVAGGGQGAGLSEGANRGPSVAFSPQTENVYVGSWSRSLQTSRQQKTPALVCTVISSKTF